ncbi:MAG: hypothetical protein N2C14_08355 [Planctomycetales bacterium]
MVTQTVTDPPADQLWRRYLGQWNRLVSMTNWEKGRIVCQWRDALVADEVPARDFSDETWSRRVGNVSSQHVGRLRRVFQKFGQSYVNYSGLFWSHFLASLDWEDSDVWLQGAIENRWSVAVMRQKRWQALGAPPELTPKDEEIVASEFDEDAVQPSAEEVEPDDSDDGPVRENFDVNAVEEAPFDENEAPGDLAASPASVRPFENLPDFPDDVQQAIDDFKLVILKHKLEEWKDVACEDLLEAIDSLTQLALAPSE